MAQVILSMEEYKQHERKLEAVKKLKKQIISSDVFADSSDCWNTEKDVIKPFTLEETKSLVKIILEL